MTRDREPDGTISALKGSMVVLKPACRAGLTRNDFSFLARALGTSEDSIHSLVAESDMRDRLLDEPQVHRALFDRPEATTISTELFFYVVVRHRLCEEGMQDRDLADYIASLLVQFSKELTQEAGLEWSTPQVYLSTVLQAIDHSRGVERFCLVTYLGNHALFMTGVFPEHLQHRETRRGAPGLDYYENVGRTQYRVASQDKLAQKYQLSTIYMTLAEAFPVVRTSLNDLRDRYLNLGDRSLPGMG